ncbi:hypothetical protein NLJ89_g456 [Agrocybe chaxingu]|uniref:Snurportin-1 n=1 Tax=Agrocybe chaxingu TaxID=84603 RepID=A0A9W8TGI3_9AGAR|nr:hypothetical protein NLJ89_g456 [Agrocybe chaxingu]
MFAGRKTSYKLPPTTIRDRLVSQEARRTKALEEQKRRRAQKIDSTRQLDLFAGLNLGGSDEEEEEEDGEPTNVVSLASVAQYASMLVPESQDPMRTNAITSPDSSSFPLQPTTIKAPVALDQSDQPETKKRPKKRKGKKRNNKPSKWADKCMYAELLEMAPDMPWSVGEGAIMDDGLPNDLESGWVAVAPVPVGKRCLAVTHQSAGVAGIIPNTTLRSRLLGKTLIKAFPSSLPPMTILDCILDANWRDNGILHVLDVVKWKGQDVADCEARFRFWWRDTRLGELSQTVPPSTSAHSNFVSVPQEQTLKYRFPYPTTFVPVPYYASTSFAILNIEVIPAARTVREMSICVPTAPDTETASGMEVEPTTSTSVPFTFQASRDGSTSTADPSQHTVPPPSFQFSGRATTMTTRVQPDGLLLYVAEASYEPGTSPLSSWVPISGYEEHGSIPGMEGPLDLFQRLVQRRLAKQIGGGVAEEVEPAVIAALVENTKNAINEITSAANQWKVVPAATMDQILPRTEVLLDRLNQAIDPAAITSLVGKTGDAIATFDATLTILVFLFVLMFPIAATYLNQLNKRCRHSADCIYVRMQYGGTIDSITRTYVNLIKLHAERVRRNGIGAEAERTHVLLIGPNEAVEAYIRHDREFSSDKALQSLLPRSRPFTFGTIDGALRALDTYCTTEEKMQKMFFILLLISSQDPLTRGPHKHQAFQVPASLRDHYYAIIGTGGNGVPAHRLSVKSKGPDGEPLSLSLPLGQKDAGVCF